MSSWWCYISFTDLYRAVYRRDPTQQEKDDYKKLSVQQLNQWVVDHMSRSHGTYVGVMMGKYLAFTILPYFMKGIWDRALVFNEGSTGSDFVTSANRSFWFEVIKQNSAYRLVTHWNNGSIDQGTSEISLNVDGYLHNYRVYRSDYHQNVWYNFDKSIFQQAGQGAESTHRFVTAGLE